MHPDIDCADSGCGGAPSRGELDGVLEEAFSNSIELLQFGFNFRL